MENKQSPSKKKLLSIQEEKLIRKVDYDAIAGAPVRTHKNLLLDLEILQKGPSPRKLSQRVLVSIKPRAPIPIKTIYIAEKNRFHSRRGSDKSGTRLAIGDHSSSTTHNSEERSSSASPIRGSKKRALRAVEETKDSSDTDQIDAECVPQNTNLYNAKHRTSEKCYVYAQPNVCILKQSKLDRKPEELSAYTKDVATFIAAAPVDTITRPTIAIVNNLNRRIDQLERKLLRQEMVFRTIDPLIHLSSSDDESEQNNMKSTSGSGRPGCSYIEQYSHVPETSAFQRYAQQTTPLSPSKATTIEKEHNSEQYGRDFTAYDGITARGRRQCASVPCKRDEAPKLAAERVHKIRHKLNPVRDYRLMDTVHYLAQGEFAPRDDGIKLTPSREAVLSDIIWEDVCRTHWPSARLGRRVAHPERCSTRGELQRLIDSLLRERVAHVERRRRRHYRIVKLNHRHESCRPVGKTGDIIVASHKNKQPSQEKDINDHSAASAMITNRKWQEHSSQKSHKSHDRLTSPEASSKRRVKQDEGSTVHSSKRRGRQDECSPGPSYATPRAPGNWESTCCYRASSPTKLEKLKRVECKKKLTSSSSGSSSKPRTPRLVVKKDATHKKYHQKEEPNLEHFILLPTLVIRTPSNVKRQKKFNELYHRILNVQINNGQDCAVGTEAAERRLDQKDLGKKDIGFNINITLSGSEERIKK